MTGSNEMRRQVRHQVWESLTSMLQAYAHAASLNGDQYAVTRSATAAAVKCGAAELNLTFSPESGAANWQSMRGDRGAFQIDEHGILIFPQGPKELDAAAIDWIDQLGKLPEAGKQCLTVPRNTGLGCSTPDNTL